MKIKTHADRQRNMQRKFIYRRLWSSSCLLPYPDIWQKPSGTICLRNMRWIETCCLQTKLSRHSKQCTALKLVKLHAKGSAITGESCKSTVFVLAEVLRDTLRRCGSIRRYSLKQRECTGRVITRLSMYWWEYYEILYVLGGVL